MKAYFILPDESRQMETLIHLPRIGDHLQIGEDTTLYLVDFVKWVIPFYGEHYVDLSLRKVKMEE